MRPHDTDALEAQAWQDFLQRLGDHLAAQWPAMQERLGERYAAFIELAGQHAGKCGLSHAANVARYVNLWFVWGTAFHDKPGFEWAQAVLPTAGRSEWLGMHQLVQRSRAELQRLPGALIDAQTLARVDALLLETFGTLGSRGAMHRPEPVPLPRVACDLEAVEWRLFGEVMHQEYQLADGDWQRVPVRPPAPLRIMAGHELPALLGMLSSPPDQGPPARLQLRTRMHAVCDGDVHPALRFLGPHGCWDWAGHETRAVNWPVATRDPALFSKAGPGFALAEETSPELHRIELEVCGLRDEGEPVGALHVPVSVWPATQWWLEIKRMPAPAQELLPTPRDWIPGVTRCQVERDGVPQDAQPLQQQFQGGLDTAVAAGLRRLSLAWTESPGLSSTCLDAQLGLLVGSACATWGWRAGELDRAALMRVQALIEMDGCLASVRLGAELDLAGTRTRISLFVCGQAALSRTLQRDAPDPPLLDVMLPATVRWSYPFELSLEPLANESGCLLQQAGPVHGALVGEAGLRPGTKGRSGWEWYAGLRLEPVMAPLQITDPLLGSMTLMHALLPAMVLVDWSLD